MRPDKCGEYDPIRTPFDPTDLAKPIEWLMHPLGGLLYTKGRPIHLSGQMWNRSMPADARFPSPLFANDWTGQFDGRWAKKVGIEKIEAFVFEMFRMTGSDFALLTTESDLKVKNTAPPSVSLIGRDPAEKGVPGLYWINLFSDAYAGWLRLDELPKALAVRERLPGGGVLLKFSESPDDCRSLDVLQRQRTAIEWLGPERFFDHRFPDRKQEVPNWEALPLPGRG